ncbi:MAG TPA: YajQ family cyclic di-GMP-binding protein [Patescibacteria group bacterium]|nr:YajQ family cyclic di-GMP-binding protein [Patescibacteria group bacterium]
MADSSFDIVSQFDRQELVNALDQTKRELGYRYDFNNSPYEMNLEKEELVIQAEDDYKMKAITDLILAKLIARKLDTRVLDMSGENERAGGNTVRKKIKLVAGLNQEKAKEISKYINTGFKKVKASIQGEEIRVSSTSRDTLQEVLAGLKAKDFGVPLQFTNYK